MAQINSFRDLEVWLVSMDLVDDVIQAVRAMPPREFDLRRQMTRAAISIPSNVAEGWKRKGKRGAYQNHVWLSSMQARDPSFDNQMEMTILHLNV